RYPQRFRWHVGVFRGVGSNVLCRASLPAPTCHLQPCGTDSTLKGSGIVRTVVCLPFALPELFHSSNRSNCVNAPCVARAEFPVSKRTGDLRYRGQTFLVRYGPPFCVIQIAICSTIRV